MKQVVLYGRVSREEQAAEGTVSIDEQRADMRARVTASAWRILNEFIDQEDYKATQAPKRGKIVNCSGERADRPHFLAMLEVVKTGEADVVMCWRDDRLVRHPRVAVALEDALDEGDLHRNGAGKIRVCDATGAEIDRFALSIKATIWREENKRRAERTRMGKTGTLKAGRWPGEYNRLGYAVRREESKRGVEIGLGDKSEVDTVRVIYHLADTGLTSPQISAKLIARGAEQKGRASKYTWSPAVIDQILHAEDYTGKATWYFGDGVQYSVPIPPIIARDLWERVQARRKKNVDLSVRHAGGVYLLQGLARCGECEGAVGAVMVRYHYRLQKDGSTRRYTKRESFHSYRCMRRTKYIGPNQHHPQPYNWPGAALDWTVWRAVVDRGIRNPELILEQIRSRQEELRSQGDSCDGDITHAEKKIESLGEERAGYQRQNARGKMTEAEFDARMAETDDARAYWQGELKRLRELRDDSARVDAGLSYAQDLLTALQVGLPKIDQPPEELKRVPAERRAAILKRRQGIIRALVDRVILWADGRIRIEGLIDGDDSAQFGIADSVNDFSKLLYLIELSAADVSLADSLFAHAARMEAIR